MRLTDILVPSEKMLRQYTGGCATCPRALQDFVPATLKPTKIIIVGEAPGADEVKQGEGFIGKSGQVLRKALKEVGIHEFSLSNTIHCRPPGNADPKPKEIGACMNQHVMPEVENYPIVVLAGSVPINAFFPGHANQVRGHLAYHPDFPNSRFFSILHPASIGYEPARKDEFYQQIDRLGRIFRGNDDVPFRMVGGNDFIARWSSFLEETTILSLDSETDRLESWTPGGKIKSLAACSITGDEVFAIDPSDPYWNTALQLLKQYLQNPEKQVLGQNIGFDLVWFEQHLDFRCDLKYIHDLQALYYQLKGTRSVALKPLVAEELDGYRHLVVWPHLEKDPRKLKLYNAEDVWYPKELFLRDFPKLRPATRDLCLRVLGPSSLATRRITHAGIHFRSEAWGALNQEYIEARAKAIADWQAADPLFDPRLYITEKGFSDLDHYIYQVKGYPSVRKTDSGRESVDEATIKELIRGGAKELEFCLTIKGIDKRRSTYILAYPRILASDRRIHANFNTTVTSTGRLSSSDPNMQNNPRNDLNYKNQIRWLFGAPIGSRFGEGDFSQIELRIAMCLSGDPVGMQIYRDGGDIHIETARSILQDEPADPSEWKRGKWKDARFKAKSANFCLIYGGSPDALQVYALNEFGVAMSDSEANRWHKGFFSRYRALEPWHEKTISDLRVNQGILESATGHVWNYRNWNNPDQWEREHEERAAINSTCQGPAAQMMSMLIFLVQQQFWKRGIKAPGLRCAEVVLTVHDSLCWEVGEDQAEESVTIVHSVLHDVSVWAKDWFTVPLVLDTKLGQVWDAD